MEAALGRLLTWTSPNYPIGGFSYSHGLEWAVEQQTVRNVAGLVEYISAVLTRGGGWIDAVLFAQAWRTANDSDALDEISELAAAFRGTSETLLESCQQGSAFLQVTLRAWPHPLLNALAARQAGHPVAHCVAMAVACAAHQLPLPTALLAYLHALSSNLVSAGLRLVPLGQTDGQIAIARLAPEIEATTSRAIAADLDDLGTASPGLEFCSMFHETQYTRLFRS